MKARTPRASVALLDKAFNRGDLQSVLDFYEKKAVVVVKPCRLARGHSQISYYDDEAGKTSPVTHGPGLSRRTLPFAKQLRQALMIFSMHRHAYLVPRSLLISSSPKVC